jgi:hypothetical protein|tara:strand:- start:2391 stop:2663 length:273 start_codon:yes stop_codon:yes gene_type:complete
VAVLPPDATFDDFVSYTESLRGSLSLEELDYLWERRQKLLGLRVVTGRGFRSQLPADEQYLTREQRGRKAEAEAKAAGRNIERLPDKAYF